jgi:NADPH:quinone reductase
VNRQVNLTKRVKTESGLRYCPVVLAANGRIRPNYVLVDGKQEVHPEGAYYLEWRNGARRVYAEFMRVPVRNVSPMPKSLSFAQAAAIPVASLTAFQALFHAATGGLIPGQKVLIHGAAGGVGSFAMQFAKSGGLLVAATCSANNVAYVRSLGADRVSDYKAEDIGRAIRDWSAEGVDVVLDVVGSTTLPHALDMLRPGGRLVSILTVTADGDIERDRKEAERRGFRKIAFIIDFDRARDSIREITNLIDAGLVRVPPIEMLPLEDAARAHRMIETGHVRGKLVLKIADFSA